MSWKKRPSIIKTDKVSVTIPYHIGMEEIVIKEDLSQASAEIEDINEILSGDLDYE